jgi:hypothetical protein
LTIAGQPAGGNAMKGSCGSLVIRLILAAGLALSASPLWAQDGTPAGPPSLSVVPVDLGDDFTVLITVEKNLPPDPGEADEATLEGVDSDNDGVRDNIERRIVYRFPDNKRARETLYRSAIQYQRILANANDGNTVRDAHARILGLAACLRTATGGTARTAFKVFGDVLLDTPERIEAYLQSQELLTVDPIPPIPTTCP